MKIIALLLIVSSNCIIAQDLITKKDGEDINAKILEVGINEVKFKKVDNLEGPTYSVLKSEILIIRYKNGDKEIFKTETEKIPNENSSTNSNSNNNVNFSWQGEQDAQRYYRGYRGHKLGTFLPCIFIGPLFGLIPAGANSATDVKDKHLVNNNQPDLFKNNEYHDAYVYKAKSIKRRKVWGGYFGGSAIFLGALVILAGAGF